MALPRVAGGSFAPDQPALFEIAQQARQITGVEIERAADLACGGRIRARDLVKHPRLAERIGAVEERFAQYADLPRVKAVEAAHRRDAISVDAMFGAPMGVPVQHGAASAIYLTKSSIWPKRLGGQFDDAPSADAANEVAIGIAAMLGMAAKRGIKVSGDDEALLGARRGAETSREPAHDFANARLLPGVAKHGGWSVAGAVLEEAAHLICPGGIEHGSR